MATVPAELKERLDAMAEDAVRRVEEAKTPEEKIEALENLEATKTVLNAYLFDYDTMVKLA